MNHGKREREGTAVLAAWWEKHHKAVLITMGVLATVFVARGAEIKPILSFTMQ